MSDDRKDLWVVKAHKPRGLKGLEEKYESPEPVSQTEADLVKASLSRKGFEVEVIPAENVVPKEIKK